MRKHRIPLSATCLRGQKPRPSGRGRGWPLKHKKVLITAGPTWVAVDDVRVISNISSGQMGILLAQEAQRLNARTEILLGPVAAALLPPGVRVRRYRYFQELSRLLNRRLRGERFDVILHAAAVSDYLAYRVRGKISSKRKALVLKLRRAPKLACLIRRLHPEAFLVIFKLEQGMGSRALVRRAVRALRACGADMAVANTLMRDGGYKGIILDKQRVLARCSSRKDLARRLLGIITRKTTS